jgi:hypothetical protein
VKACSIFLSVSGLFHIVQCLPVLHVLQWQNFLKRSNIPLYVCMCFLNCSLSNIYIVSTPWLLYMGVQMYLQDSNFIFFGYIPKSSIAGYGSSVFHFKQDLPTVFHNPIPIYIPTNSEYEFPFLHILKSNSNLLTF